MRRGLIIHNPVSGLSSAYEELNRARAYLAARGWSIDIEHTGGPGDAGRLAREAANAGLYATLVAGGDGTLNEAVNALVGTDTAVGVLPCGTGNMWARQLGMPSSVWRLLDAARSMNEASLRKVDLGRVTVRAGTPEAASRYFLLWAGVGLDGRITRSIEPRPPWFKRWGIVSYALAALRIGVGYVGAQAEIEIDGRSLSEHVVMVLVCNADLYAGIFHLAPEARLDDGCLNVSVIRGWGIGAVAGYFTRVLLHRHVRVPSLVTLPARRVRIVTRPTSDVHVDAEPLGSSPVECSIAPRALRVLVPPNAPAALFEPV